MKYLKIALLAFPVFAMLSCGNNEEANNSSNPVSQAPNSNKKVLEAELKDGKQIIVLKAGDDMKFNAKEIKLKANIPVELTLQHTGKIEAKTMGHNVVILKPDVVVPDFANAANASEATSYIPQDMKSSIIAYTKMLGGGESDTITFTIESTGTYPFLCSFPGHSGIMKGKIIVE